LLLLNPGCYECMKKLLMHVLVYGRMSRFLSVSVVIIAMLETNTACVSSNWNMMIVR